MIRQVADRTLILGALKAREFPKPERDVWGPFNAIMIDTILTVLSKVDGANFFDAKKGWTKREARTTPVVRP